jgi:type I restriction enzyme M protein
VEEIKARGYDLTARNPNRQEAAAHRHPAEITASLLEKEREILDIIQELHEMVGNGNDTAV